MPPKKRSRRGVSTPARDDDGMEIDAPTPDVEEQNEPPTPAYDILKDPWTDEQETALFKAIIKWKPNGVHKHFRMIAIAEYLRNNGHDEKHTHIPGIWEKLGTMYDMEMIDSGEKPFDDEESNSPSAPFIDFEPPDEFAEAMFMRGKRGPSEAQSSPAGWNRTPSPRPTSARTRKRGDPVTTTKARASTVEDTDEARTSPPRSPPAKKKTRAGRSATRSQVRAKAQSTSRAPSKDTTMDEDEGENETEETAEDDEQEAEEEADEEERSVSPRPTRGSSRAKADAEKASNPSRKSKRKR